MKLKDWFNTLPEQFLDELECEVFAGNIGLTLKKDNGEIVLHSAKYNKREDLIPQRR